MASSHCQEAGLTAAQGGATPRACGSLGGWPGEEASCTFDSGRKPILSVQPLAKLVNIKGTLSHLRTNRLLP